MGSASGSLPSGLRPANQRVHPRALSCIPRCQAHTHAAGGKQLVCILPAHHSNRGNGSIDARRSHISPSQPFKSSHPVPNPSDTTRPPTLTGPSPLPDTLRPRYPLPLALHTAPRSNVRMHVPLPPRPLADARGQTHLDRALPPRTRRSPISSASRSPLGIQRGSRMGSAVRLFRGGGAGRKDVPNGQ